MDSSTYKLYHKGGYDSRQCLEHYFSDKPDMVFAEDALSFPIENLIKTFTEGHIKGDILIDLSIGSLLHHLFAACEFFKHVIVLKANERCILELKRWVDERTGAFSWSHVAKLHGDIGDSSDLLQDKEGKVRSALQHVLKFDLEKENMLDPIELPLADCIICAWLLDYICKNQDDFMRNLRKFSKLLKPEGNIIIIGCLGVTYYTIGKDKFHAFNYNEEIARNALVGEGFIIDRCEIKQRTAVSDLTDYKEVLFIAAHKQK